MFDRLMNSSLIRPLLVAAVLSAVIAPGLAAEEPAAALQACRTEPVDARRLACYDSEFDRQERLTASGAAVPVTAPAAATPTAEERFGYQGVLAREEREKLQSAAPDLEELRSTVADISRRADGVLIVTLENGQVWMQKTPDPDFRLRIGDPAKVKRSAMGSYFLYGNSSWSTRVTRLH